MLSTVATSATVVPGLEATTSGCPPACFMHGACTLHFRENLYWYYIKLKCLLYIVFELSLDSIRHTVTVAMTTLALTDERSALPSPIVISGTLPIAAANVTFHVVVEVEPGTSGVDVTSKIELGARLFIAYGQSTG